MKSDQSFQLESKAYQSSKHKRVVHFVVIESQMLKKIKDEEQFKRCLKRLPKVGRLNPSSHRFIDGRLMIHTKGVVSSEELTQDEEKLIDLILSFAEPPVEASENMFVKPAQEQVSRRSIECPACGTPFHYLSVDAQGACANPSCGELITPSKLLGLIPQREALIDVIMKLAKFQSFTMKRLSSGGEYIKFDEASLMTSGELFILPSALGARSSVGEVRLDESLRGRVRSATRVELDEEKGLDLIYYEDPFEETTPLAELIQRDPKAAVRMLLELRSELLRSEIHSSKLSPEDLEVLNDRLRHRYPHKLNGRRAMREDHLIEPWDIFIGKDLNSDLLKRDVALWYHLFVGDLLGLRASDADFDRLLSPRVRRPGLPPGVWAALQPALFDNYHWEAESALSSLNAPLTRGSVRLTVAQMSQLGEKRNRNQEDRSGFTWIGSDSLLLALGDGVSSSGWGERAAQCVVDSMMLQSAHGRAPTRDELKEILNRANRLCGELICSLSREEAEEGGQLSGSTVMSSTGLAAYLDGETAMVASIGDSPCILYRKGGIEVITFEHSQSMMDIREGSSLADAKGRDGASQLERYIGDFEFCSDDLSSDEIDPSAPQDLTPSIDFVQLELCDGDILLFCSDGVTDFLKLREIASTIRSEIALQTQGVAERITERLVESAVKRQRELGYGDNTTLITVFVEGHQSI